MEHSLSVKFFPDDISGFLAGFLYIHLIFLTVDRGKKENYECTGHCSKVEAELKFVLKGVQSLRCAQKYCITAKFTVLTENLHVNPLIKAN